MALAVTGIVLYITNSTYKLALAKEQQSLTQAGNAAQQGLDQYGDSAASLVRTMATDQQVLSVMNGDPAKAQARLASMVKANTMVWSLLVFDAQGKVLAGSNAQGQDLTGQSRADRDYYKAVMGGTDLFVPKSVLLSKTGGADMHIFTAAHSIRDAAGKVVGGVGAFLKWTAFNRPLSSTPCVSASAATPLSSTRRARSSPTPRTSRSC